MSAESESESRQWRSALVRSGCWGAAVVAAFLLVIILTDGTLHGIHFFVAVVLGFSAGSLAWMDARKKRRPWWMTLMLPWRWF